MNEKEIKGITKSITASGRMSVKLGNNYYTFEFTEERSVPEDCDLEIEREELWNTVIGEVERQVDYTVDLYKANQQE